MQCLRALASAATISACAPAMAKHAGKLERSPWCGFPLAGQIHHFSTMTGAQNSLIFIAQQWEDVVQTGQVEVSMSRDADAMHIAVQHSACHWHALMNLLARPNSTACCPACCHRLAETSGPPADDTSSLLCCLACAFCIILCCAALLDQEWPMPGLLPLCCAS